jgi:phosphoribosylformylglycinamidine synthase subunit PurL
LGSILDVLPREGALFAGRSGAVPLPDGRVLLVTTDSAQVVSRAVEPAGNEVPAPPDGLSSSRPAYLDEYPLFGCAPEFPDRTFADLWPQRDEPDDYVHRDPYTGSLIRVAQALRAAAAMTAAPAALSFRLRCGDPDDPEVAYQLRAVVEGLADAARMFQLPVLAGDVTTDGTVGLHPELEVCSHTAAGATFSTVRPHEAEMRQGAAICLAGRMTDDLGGSLYAGDVPGFPPPIDIVVEGRVLDIVREIGGGAPLARGGLLLTLARCCGRVRLGAHVTVPAAWHDLLSAAVWFGEAQSRFLLFLPPERLPELRDLAMPLGVPVERIGTVGGSDLEVEGVITVKVEELR